MPSGRETCDAYLFGCEAFGSGDFAREDAERLHGILERYFGVAVGHPVLEYGGRDPVRGKPFGHVVAFVVHAEQPVAAARADHDGQSGGCCGGGREDVEFGLRRIGDTVPFGFRFGGRDAVGVGRSAVVPDPHRGGLPVVAGCGCGRQQREGCSQQGLVSHLGSLFQESARSGGIPIGRKRFMTGGVSDQITMLMILPGTTITFFGALPSSHF